MIKQRLYVLLFLFSLTNSNYANIIKGNVILSSTLIKAIDGKSFGIHGQMLYALLKIRTRILRMLYGVTKEQGHEGLYLFNEKNYTVQELCALEKNMELNPTDQWLETVKKDFATQISPFLDLGRGFKPQMLLFIEESLQLHGRSNKQSILLKWAETKEGDDMAGFNIYVRSFADLELFLHDLLNFLDDLVSSCPKAKQQLIDNLKSEQEKKIYTQRFQKLFEQQKKKINQLHAH